MVGKLSPGQNGKVFGQAFFKKLAGDKRGRRPLLCSAARRKTRSKCRNAKQIKFRAGQKQRSDFLAAPFHKAPPGRQKSEREFACSEGVFCARRAAPCGGLIVFARPAVLAAAFVPGLRCSPVLCFVCAAFLSCFFTLSCLTFASQKSFHLSLRPRRALSCLSPPAALFPACGSCHLLLFREPLRPLPVCLFCVVRAGFLPCFSPFPAPLFPLKLLFTCRSGRDGPLLSSEKKVDKDSRGGAVAPPSNPHSCALRPISPFPALLAGLTALRAANRRQVRETLEKAKEQSSAFSSVSVQRGTSAPFC